MTALELFSSGAYDAEWSEQHARLETIASGLSGRPATCTIEGSIEAERSPTLAIAIDEDALGRTAFDVCRGLRDGTPPVYVGHGRLAQGTLVINPLCMSDDQAPELSRRIGEELGG